MLMESYLSNRFKRVKIGDIFSDWLRVVKGIPKGSVLGPLFFNIFMNDIMYTSFHSYVSSYADDIQLFKTGFDVIERECRLILFQPPSGLRPTPCVSMLVNVTSCGWERTHVIFCFILMAKVLKSVIQ